MGIGWVKEFLLYWTGAIASVKQFMSFESKDRQWERMAIMTYGVVSQRCVEAGLRTPNFNIHFSPSAWEVNITCLFYNFVNIQVQSVIEFPHLLSIVCRWPDIENSQHYQKIVWIELEMSQYEDRGTLSSMCTGSVNGKRICHRI